MDLQLEQASMDVCLPSSAYVSCPATGSDRGLADTYRRSRSRIDLQSVLWRPEDTLRLRVSLALDGCARSRADVLCWLRLDDCTGLDMLPWIQGVRVSPLM